MKITKDAVEHFGGVWPYPYSIDLGLRFTPTYGWDISKLDASGFVCTKQQFEGYVKEKKWISNINM